VTRSAPPVYVRADDPQALADAFREAHEAHGATGNCSMRSPDRSMIDDEHR
jgi:hypothetical protein